MPPNGTILFVCSGNTCRSPMAERIAQQLIERHSTGQGVRVLSAGTGAFGGSPASPEVGEALKAAGYDPGPVHVSRPLEPSLIGEAMAIFGMTRDHVRAILALDPSAADRTHTLDPDGVGIDDPIGGTQFSYNQTAKRMEGLIEARLKELEL